MAILWLIVTHTFKGNGPKLADWSKSICITLRSRFCSLLTSNWEVNTGRFLNSFHIFFYIRQQFVISSDIENIETNLPIGKHTLGVFTKYFQRIFGKTLFRCFIYVFVLICSVLCLFQRFMLLNPTLWFTVTHAFEGNGPKLADWSK